MKKLLLLTASALLGGHLATAASIVGTVTAGDPPASVPGARVTLFRASTAQQETNTDAQGRFAFEVPDSPSEYEIAIEALGFKRELLQGVRPVAGQPLSVAAPLQIDPLQQSITVFAAVPQLETKSEITQTLESRRLVELPSNGRELVRFAMLDPRARNTIGSGSDGRSATRIALNGQSFRFTQYVLDGSTNYDFVFSNGPQQALSLAAVGEFKLLANQFSAENGRTSAGILVASTKAGTDDIHGEAFWFLRPSGLQAAPPVSTFRVPNERQHLGGTVGGPIVRGRTYYFASIEGSAQRRGSYIQSPTPDFFTGEQRAQMALARIDHRFNDRHFGTLRLNGDRLTNNNLNDAVGGFVQPSAAQRDWQQSGAVQTTLRSMFGQTLNDLRLSYANVVPLARTSLAPQVRVVRPSYSTEGSSFFDTVRTQTWQIANTVGFRAGRHDFKVGGDAVRQKARDWSVTREGEYRFAPGAPVAGERPLQFTQTFGEARIRYGQSLASLFVQDEWRMTSRFTTSLGLRYEHQSITADRNNFAPRLGFSYDVTGQGKTVVRGGAGLFYDQVFQQITRNAMLNGFLSPTATYTLAYGAPGFPVFPYSLAEPPAVASARRDIYTVSERLLNPYTGQFTLGVEQAIGQDWTVGVNGIVYLSRKQLRVGELNRPAPFLRTAPGQQRSIAAADATRPLRGLRNVNVIENSGTSHYTALDLKIAKRFSRRFQVEGRYLYSSQISDVFFTGGPNTGTPSDWGMAGRDERGPGDFHQRHRLVTNGFVSLPWASQLSLVAIVASGLPVNPLTGADTNGDGVQADRPWGFGRNSFRGPAQAALDASYSKRIRLTESSSIELRAEAFNVLNRTNALRLNPIYGNGFAPLAGFLQPVAGVTNTDPARQLQLALRWLF